jgi:ketosteroid isomerase-like protein
MAASGDVRDARKPAAWEGVVMSESDATDARSFADEMFAVVDRLDADAFATYYAEDAVLRFGNAEPVRGRDAIRQTFADFFATLDGLRHDMQHHFYADDTHLAEAHVTYTRRDGSLVTVPAMSVFHRRPDGLIDSYRIYVDLAPLFA